MNIPEIYLIEPYNAYAPKGRKKHWHEIVEEQALMARIIAEQQARQQAIQEAQNKNSTLPPQAPAQAQQTAQGSSGGAGAAGASGTGGGGGGTPVWDFWNEAGDVVNFSFAPTGGIAPLTVVFTNLTTTPQFDTYNWYFGDGATSTDVNPTHVYQTSSNATNIWTCSLQVTNSITLATGSTKTSYISASIPRVTAAFTFTTSSNIGPVTASFTNTTVNTSQTPTTTYLWTFGDGTSSSLASPSHPYANTGSFTASLQATGSYGLTSRYTQSFFVTAPSLVSNFTWVSQSNGGPSTYVFTTAVTYSGHGNVTGSFIFGDGTTAAYTGSGTYTHQYGTGSWTASLSVTESTYNLTSKFTHSFAVPQPQVTASFTFTTSSNSAPATVTFLNTSTYDGGGTLTYLWSLGTGSLTSSAVIPNPTSYTAPGPYTASLQITESAYHSASMVTHSFRLS